MTHESQIIAITKLCGWTMFYGEVALRRDIPDYLNNLNVIRNVVLACLPFQDEGKFIANLERITHRDGGRVRPVFADAKQWCEALLRTLNLWEEA